MMNYSPRIGGWVLLTSLWALQWTVLSPQALVCAEDGAEKGWQQTRVIAAAEATQAAAVDERYAYAINNTHAVRYDRQTGEKLVSSTGKAKHLNSGFLQAGKLYCAHSNYPQTPEESQIMQVDLETMELSTFHSFGQSRHGSLTVAVLEDGHWWCVFAKYGAENAQTVFVKYDEDWQERGV